MTEAHRGGTCMGDRPKDGRRLLATVLIDLLTLSRIPLAAVFCALSLVGESLASRVALFALIVLSDLFDGRLARRLAVQSALGAILDVTADLFFVTTAITTLCVLGLLPWWLLCVALLMFVEFVIALSPQGASAARGRCSGTTGSAVLWRSTSCLLESSSFTLCSGILPIWLSLACLARWSPCWHSRPLRCG